MHPVGQHLYCDCCPPVLFALGAELMHRNWLRPLADFDTRQIMTVLLLPPKAVGNVRLMQKRLIQNTVAAVHFMS